MTEKEQFNDALAYIKKHYQDTPTIGIILGTGLGELVQNIDIEKEIPYNFIPHFPISTVESHFGRLIFGSIGGKKIVAMQGRFHYYEGYSMRQIIFPVRILKMLGIKTLLISNAAGSMNPNFKKGDLMIIDDHIGLQGDSPLRGAHDDKFGPRFPDMSKPYSPELISLAMRLGIEVGAKVHTGVYVAVAGPQLETRAEYRYLRMIGADVVGMSTVPEVMAAHQMGITTFAVSVITDECDPEHLKPVSIEEIIATAQKAEPAMTQLMCKIIENLPAAH